MRDDMFWKKGQWRFGMGGAEVMYWCGGNGLGKVDGGDSSNWQNALALKLQQHIVHKNC